MVKSTMTAKAGVNDRVAERFSLLNVETTQHEDMAGVEAATESEANEKAARPTEASDSNRKESDSTMQAEDMVEGEVRFSASHESIKLSLRPPRRLASDMHL